MKRPRIMSVIIAGSSNLKRVGKRQPALIKSTFKKLIKNKNHEKI